MDPHFGAAVLSTAYFPPVEYFFAVAHSDRILIEQHEAYQKQSWRNRCRILAAAGPEDLSIPVVKEERLSRPIRDIRIDYGEPWLQHHVRAFAAAYNHSAYYEYYADDLLPILERRPVFLFDLNMALLEKLMALLGLDTPISLTDRFVAPLRSAIPLLSQKKCSFNGIAPAPLRSPNGEIDESALARWPGGEISVPRGECPTATRVLISPQEERALPDGAVLDGRERIQPKYKGKSLLAEYACEQAYYQVFVNEMPGQASSFIPNLSILDLLSAEGPNAASFLRI